MAFTSTEKFLTVVGDKRMQVLEVTADANSGAVDTGLTVIDSAHATPKSAATFSRVKCKENVNSGGTALNGTVFMSSCTSGDAITLVVYGR